MREPLWIRNDDWVAFLPPTIQLVEKPVPEPGVPIRPDAVEYSNDSRAIMSASVDLHMPMASAIAANERVSNLIMKVFLDCRFAWIGGGTSTRAHDCTWILCTFLATS